MRTTETRWRVARLRTDGTVRAVREFNTWAFAARYRDALTSQGHHHTVDIGELRWTPHHPGADPT